MLPYDQIPGVHRWSDDPFQISGGGDGLTEYEPSAPYTSYWNMRYFKLISAPSVD